MWVRLFNRTGRPMAQLTPHSAARAWRLNNIGKASISIPRTSPKVTERLLRFGNLIAIESDDALIWGGVILPPRRWKQDYVTITAYSGERLLKYRALPKEMETKDSSPGAIFAEIIEYIGAEYQPNLDPGRIKKRGRATSFQYHYDDAWDVIRELVELAENDLWIEPYYDKNRWLRFKAHFFERRGKDKSGKVALIENVNMKVPTSLRESGEIVNEWIYYGAGDDWSTIPVGEHCAEQLAGRMGRWTDVQAVPDVTNQKTLQEMARQRVKETKYAKALFRVACLNKDNLWLKLRPGDEVTLQSSTIGWNPDGGLGFRGKVKIISCALNEAQGYMVVVAEEVQE